MCLEVIRGVVKNTRDSALVIQSSASRTISDEGPRLFICTPSQTVLYNTNEHIAKLHLKTHTHITQSPFIRFDECNLMNCQMYCQIVIKLSKSLLSVSVPTSPKTGHKQSVKLAKRIVFSVCCRIRPIINVPPTPYPASLTRTQLFGN